jgi:hypothetical protein
MWRFVVAAISAASLSAISFFATAQPLQSNESTQAQSPTTAPVRGTGPAQSVIGTPNPQRLDMDAVPSLTADRIRKVQQALVKKASAQAFPKYPRSGRLFIRMGV